MLLDLLSPLNLDGSRAALKTDGTPVVDVSHVDLLMCFRSFTPDKSSVPGEPPVAEWLISVDWPGFGGGLAVMDD